MPGGKVFEKPAREIRKSKGVIRKFLGENLMEKSEVTCTLNRLFSSGEWLAQTWKRKSPL